MSRTIPFQPWHHHTTTTTERAPVFPDGCRDVLIVREPGTREKIVLTVLDLRPRVAELSAGTEITGYRLRPGAVVGDEVLAELERDCGRAEEVLGNALSADAAGDAADEILLALVAPGASVESVAADLGVSKRTLQRQLKAFGLPAPDYWRLLARARRAAGLLASGLALPEIADLCGFSDQAHMTRDFRSWFGGTPAQLRRAPHILELLCQPALGNWTGEQISTR
ncbi:helix-turn-helix domain-containing protein [Roseibium sediminicola]|uniref:Helix-turn-helix domain-containing protein n=1 Tax=Roseibium sediminicola TaxID=2933272 RepID=A0ABT0H1D5_9HYPH|nr:helix-turn-helix domain-containing protein [Roseibium sp. CAU 1639]MCK7615502.1 helix-turn-helix domain-containing protein [Roseibium sp. CAU 1639]